MFLAAALLLAVAPPTHLDAATRAQILDAVVEKLHRYEMDPKETAAVERDLRSARKRHALDQADPEQFAAAVTQHMRGASHDKHLGLTVLDHPRGELEPPGEVLPPEFRARLLERAKHGMYGIAKIERLPGNVGLLQLDAMNFADVAGGALTHALRLLADTDALIIDLRHNGGGDPMSCALITGFLVRGDRLLQEIQYGYKPAVQFRTPSWPPAGYYGDGKPVYVLTSKDTISAGEALPYALQGLKRATIVGERTAGAANAAVGLRAGNDFFAVALTVGRTVSAFTGTSWEGTGVKPDVAVDAADALRVAHLAALRTLAHDASGAAAEELKEAIAPLEKPGSR